MNRSCMVSISLSEAEVTIGRGSVAAAGSVVVGSVPPAVIVAGHPAVVVGELDPATSSPSRHS